NQTPRFVDELLSRGSPATAAQPRKPSLEERMDTPEIGELVVPGARLYYEVVGTGPALVLVPTGNGDAGPFRPIASLLADRYTVITYDRRGFSRSPLDGPVDDERRLETDVDDVLRLLAHLADGPACVFGTCSGAIVALALLERHPDRVRALVAHEPPLASVLPNADEELEFHENLYELYRTAGVDEARQAFGRYLGATGASKPPEEFQPPPDELADMLARTRRNLTFWFDHEVRSFPAVVPDTVALKAASAQLVLAGGTTSREQSPYRANAVLAGRVGLDLEHFPGGHLGHVTDPVEFAERLHEVLLRNGKR
ncbi:alpha/beta fold hydrolase, partial [Amycolatopsis sp. H20-H5]|uniref:alpha/beta fold hydrolase n=1 Tax=Amycolatopsis sp. H20-H5 TaxID=3046309 RepID=UPI002DBF728B